MLNRLLIIVFSALALTVPSPFTGATSVAPEREPLHVYRVQMVDSGPFAHTGRMIVTLSNHKSDVLRPCRVEDGRHCYFNATVRGNGEGQSFIVTRGHKFPITF